MQRAIDTTTSGFVIPFAIPSSFLPNRTERDSGTASWDLSGPGEFGNYNVTTQRSRVPNWSAPQALTDAELARGINAWPGSDNDPLFDGLVAEFERRVEPDGGWHGLGQHQVVVSDFTARANGLEEQLLPGDNIGRALAGELEAAGFEADVARDIAAHLRVQYGGDEVALQLGLDAALEQMSVDSRRLWDGGVSAERFADTLNTAGDQTVLGMNQEFFTGSRSAIATAAEQSGKAYDDTSVAQILAFAIRNGTTVAGAARHYFGLDVDRPPAGLTVKDLVDPETIEIGLRIDQQQTTTSALNKLAGFDYENAVARAVGNGIMTDFDGDGMIDFTFNPDGRVVETAGNSGTSEIDLIVDLVGTVAALAPTQEQIENQQQFVEQLKDAQLGISMVATGAPDLLDASQVELLDRIDSYGSQIHGLMMAPGWGPDGERYATGVDALRGLLDQLAASDDHGYSPGFLTAMNELLADQELVEQLAWTGSNDLFEAPAVDGEIDLDRVSTLNERIILAAMLGPYVGGIDTNSDGTILPKDLTEFIKTAQDNPDLAIPDRVIEAAQAAAAAGYTDTNVLNDLHIMLDVIGTTEIPLVSQLADLTNAGLYAVVDRDLVNAGISAIGLVAGGVIAIRNGTRIVGGLADLSDAHISRYLAQGGLASERGAIAVGGAPVVRVTVPFGRNGPRTISLPPGFEPGHRLTIDFNVRRYVAQRGGIDRVEQLRIAREYVSQLKRQERAINNMTAKEFLDAREAFENNRRLTGSSRHPDAAQAQADFRAKWINDRTDVLEDELRRTGSPTANLSDDAIEAAAERQARSEAGALAALHEPDGVAGGFNNPMPVAMGDAGVNASMGASWNQSARVARMDAAAHQLVLAKRGGENMKIRLAPT